MIFLIVYTIITLLVFTFVKVTTVDNPVYHRNIIYAVLWPAVLIYVIRQILSGNAGRIKKDD